MTSNGKGFYQLHGDDLLYAPNFVENKDFQLYADKFDQYQYPVEGWYWFNDETEARIFFSLPTANTNETNGMQADTNRVDFPPQFSFLSQQ